MYHLHVVLYYTKLYVMSWYMCHYEHLYMYHLHCTCSIIPYAMSWYLYHYEHLYMYHLHIVLYYTKPYVMSWYLYHYEHLYMYHLYVVLY